VASLHVGGYAATKNLCDRPAITTEHEARCSAQFTIASIMLYGCVRLDAFASARLADPAIRAIMPPITVSLDAECEAGFPGARSAKVTMKLRNGRDFFRHQPTRKGDPDAPLSDVELNEKFMELCGPILGSPAVASFLAQLRHGASLPGELYFI